MTSHDTKLLSERTTEDTITDVGVNALVRKLQQCLQTYIQDPRKVQWALH